MRVTGLVTGILREPGQSQAHGLLVVGGEGPRWFRRARGPAVVHHDVDRTEPLRSTASGFSLSPGAVTYRVGEAMQSTDSRDLDKTPDITASTTTTLAANTTHRTRQFKATPYPPA